MNDQPKVLMSCPTYDGERFALKRWAAAYHAQTYQNKGALQVDNSNAPQYGGNLNFLHAIRAEGIPAIWQQVRWPAFWDTMEESWRIIVEYAHAHGYDFIFSVEADVIVPPEAMAKMVEAAFEHGADGKPAVVTQRYHPRGQEAPNFYWDTLGCSLFPVETLYENIHLVTAMYEIDVFVVCEKAGHPRYRAGTHGPDLFEVEHLKDPDDAYGENVGSTPANVRYTQRVDSGNRALMGMAPNTLQTEPVAAPAPEPEAEAEPPAFKPIKGPPISLTVTPAETPELIVPGYTGTDAMPVADIQHDQEVAKRVMQEDRIRLNLGSDWSQISGFRSVDFNPAVSPDIVADVRSLPMFADSTVDECYASHVLEHLSWDDGLVALKEWLRVLKPGGMLTVAVPDVEGVYLGYKRGITWGEHNLPMDETYVQATVFGANLLADKIPEMVKLYGGPGHEHKSIYIRDMLLNRVIAAGYVYAHEVNRCFLRGVAAGETMVQARKPKQGE